MPPLRRNRLLRAFLHLFREISVNPILLLLQLELPFLGLGLICHDTFSASVGVWSRGLYVGPVHDDTLAPLAPFCVAVLVQVLLSNVRSAYHWSLGLQFCRRHSTLNTDDLRLLGDVLRPRGGGNLADGLL